MTLCVTSRDSTVLSMAAFTWELNIELNIELNMRASSMRSFLRYTNFNVYPG
jgi:hypothetical protein